MKVALFVRDGESGAFHFEALTTAADLASQVSGLAGREAFAVPICWHCDWDAGKARRMRDSNVLDLSKVPTK